MIKNTLAALLIAALPCAVASQALAAESTTPQMNNGHTNRPPKTSVVSPAADQIAASNVIGADVQDAQGAIIAKITDLIVDRRSGAAALAIVEPAGGNSFDHGKSAIAWGSLRFEPRPTPHFVTALGHEAMAAGAALVEQAKTGDQYYDVKTDLLGKPVVGAGGATLGHVQDLVLTFGTGHLAALVIKTGGFISMGANNHAVAWDAAKPQTGKNGAPVRVALSKAQVEGAPVTATMAPAPIAAKPGTGQVQIKRDSTGNISGTQVPAPANHR
ncbi:MAG TPA: PRC-barrel domain-containing protein [Stellaceae bacterium]